MTLELQMAVACFLLALCMTAIVWISRMLVRRNQFIMAVEEWYLEKTQPEDPKTK